MMQKITALILSTAIVPALALSTAAIAQEQDDMKGGEPGAAEQLTGEQAAGEQDAAGQRTDEQAASGQDATGQRTGEQAAGEQDAAGQRTGEQAAGGQDAAGQRTGEQYLSGKPAGAFYADDAIGETVIHRGTDENVGEIQDLIIGEDGRVVGVVVTSGGFLGLGGQDVGLGWDRIERTMEDDESVFYTDMSEESLQNAPEYERE